MTHAEFDPPYLRPGDADLVGAVDRFGTVDFTEADAEMILYYFPDSGMAASIRLGRQWREFFDAFGVAMQDAAERLREAAAVWIDAFERIFSDPYRQLPGETDLDWWHRAIATRLTEIDPRRPTWRERWDRFCDRWADFFGVREP